MRRAIGIALSALFVVPVVFVLPVYAAPLPDPEPVEASTVAVDMGSVAAPAPAAEVQEGTTEPVAQETPAEAASPVLAVSQPRTDAFSSLGVTWAFDPAVVDVTVQVRTADQDGTWGPWDALETEASDDQGPADAADLRGGTNPLWTGERFGVEVEVLTRSGAAPTDVQVQLIDPGTSAADDTPGAPEITDTAEAAATMPAIYSRAQWGADESVRTWDPEYAPTLRAATIHHTADTNNYTADQVPQMLRSIYQYHAVSRGWGDIGYNVLVDKYGRAWEGRYGGLASTVVGAHAGGFNTGTFGVSMLGNYQDVQPPAAMLETVAQVIAWKFSLYRINPLGSTQLTSGGGGTAKYAAGAVVSLPTIFAHRDVGSTTCPGQYAYGRMDWLRSRVAAIMATFPNERWWELRDGYDAGRAQYSVWYGGPDATTLACDVDGDGRDDIIAVDAGTWYVRTSVSGGAAARVFSYGLPGWEPVCGDWDGDGKDGIGVYDRGTWYLRNTATPGAPDAGRFDFGWWAAAPVVGDWDGDRRTTVGVYERATGTWMVRNTNSAGGPDRRVQYGFPGAVPVSGDFNGDSATDLAVFASGRWYLRTSFTPGPAGRVFDYGLATDQPLAGNWDGPRGDGVGVSRAGRR